MRLFTAFQIPAQTKRDLSALTGGLMGAQWIHPEDYHVSLRFIGDVDLLCARDVAYALRGMETQAFKIRIREIGAFGGARPHAIIAFVDPCAALLALQREQESRLRRLGLAPETRKYTPHVTLARLTGGARLTEGARNGVSAAQTAAYLGSLGNMPITPFAPDRFALYSARAGRGGGPYVVEADYPLRITPARLSPAVAASALTSSVLSGR